MPRKKAEAIHVVGQVRLRLRNRTWHARYTTPAGRQEESLEVTNLRVAEKKAREISDLLERGEYAVLGERKAHGDQTFADFLVEFRANYTGWSANTWTASAGALNRLVVEFGPRPLASITPHQIESYLARRRDQDGLADATYNRYLAMLKTILKTAHRWGRIGHNPAERVTMVREQAKVPEALTDAQLEQLLGTLEGINQAIVEFAADTGMRRSELQRLSWADVDFEERSILVRQSKNKEFRAIPMSDRVYLILTERCRLNAVSRTPNAQVFPFVDIKKALHSAGVKAGIGHVHLHMLRHTFATRLRDRGVPLDRIMELLGHKSMQMVLRYAKARPQQLRGAIEALNG